MFHVEHWSWQERRGKMAVPLVPLVVARWVVVRLVRTPAAWLAFGVLFAAWPLVAALSPVGIATSGNIEAAAFYQLTFLALLVGTSAGGGVLALAAQDWLQPVPAGRRLVAEWAALTAAQLLFAGPMLLLAAGIGIPGNPWRPGLLPCGSLLCGLHLSALGLVLGRFPLPVGAVVLGIPLVAWVLPALLSGSAGLWESLPAALDAGAHLEIASERPTSVAQRIQAGVPIIGMASLAMALTRPLPHALRRPR